MPSPTMAASCAAMPAANAALLSAQVTSSPGSAASPARSASAGNGTKAITRSGPAAGSSVIGCGASDRRQPGLGEGEEGGASGAAQERPAEHLAGQGLAVDDDAAGLAMA